MEKKDELKIENSKNNLNKIPSSWSTIQDYYTDLVAKKINKSLPSFYDYYSSNDFDNVYEPAEDTFLMADTLEEEIDRERVFINKNEEVMKENTISNEFVSIEIGCGSSFVSISFVSYLLKRKSNDLKILKHFCFDINKSAVELSTKIVSKCNLNEYIDVNEGVFFDINHIKTFLKNEKKEMKKIVFIFNPPYVSTDEEEYIESIQNKNISAAWAGGKNGSEVIFSFIAFFRKNLEENFKEESNIEIVLYLLLSSENDYREIIKQLCFDYCCLWECLSKGGFKNEKLAIFKFVYNKN